MAIFNFLKFLKRKNYDAIMRTLLISKSLILNKKENG